MEFDKEIKTEQQGKNILILEKLCKPRKLWSKGKKMYYALYHRWLRDANDTTSVLGQDRTFWTAGEAKQMVAKGLFNSTDLF